MKITRSTVVGVAVFILALLFVSTASMAGEARITSTGETLYYLNTAPPIINVTPTSLDFGSVAIGSTKDLQVTVKNTGVGDLIVTGITSPAAPFSI